MLPSTTSLGFTRHAADPAIDLKDGKCVRLQQGDMNVSTTFGGAGGDGTALARCRRKAAAPGRWT